MAKISQMGTLKPIVRTAKPVHAGGIVGSGGMVKSMVGYAYCAIDGTLLSKHLGLWARNGLQCSKCKHTTWYIKREWRNVPIVDESTFDITQYVDPPKPDRNKEIADELHAADQAKLHAPDPTFEKSLLAELTRIARALERLADAWEGGDHSIKSES